MATRDQYRQYMLKEKYTKHTIDQYTGYYMNGFYNQAKLHVSSIMKCNLLQNLAIVSNVPMAS